MTISPFTTISIDYSFGWIPICANTALIVSLTAQETAFKMEWAKDPRSAIATTMSGTSRLCHRINYLTGHKFFQAWDGQNPLSINNEFSLSEA